MLPVEAINAFINSAPDYLVVFDRERRLVFANNAFRNAFLEGGDFTGVDFVSLLDPDSGERGLEALREMGTGARQVELYHRAPGGKLQPVQYQFIRLEFGNNVLLAAIGRDKTPDLELLGEITQLNIELEEKQRELMAAYARLEQYAVTDHLTGLYNRHYFFTVVQHFYEEARRYVQPLTCLMMDVDHFKGVNDRYGHAFGDQVLRTVSDRLKANSRKSDLLCRYGGEEFVLVTPNTDIRTARLLGERIRVAMEREPAEFGGISAPISISVGISGTEILPNADFEQLMESADQALYNAKRSGRNRCVVYQPVTGVSV